MKKKRKSGTGREWLYLIAAGILLLLNILILCHVAELKDERDFISLSYPAGTVTGDSFERMLEAEESQMFSEAAVWKASGRIRISAESSGRVQNADCYQIKGQPSAVFGKHLMSGRYFTEGERDVCLLDQGLAWQLFGTADVLGLEVCLDGKQYQIAGILEEDRAICVIPVETEEKNPAFDGVAVRKREPGESSKLAVNFLEVNFGGTEEQKIDGQLYWVTAWLFYAVVTAMLFVFAGIGMCVRKLEQQVSESRVFRVLRGGILPVCLIAAALVLIAGIRIADPGSDYLPSYWADFSFFGELIREKKEEIISLVRYQEFSVWGNVLDNWQKMIGGEIFLAAAGIFCVVDRAVRDR